MKIKENVIAFLILGLLVIAGTGIRVINLDRASFWVDEVNSVFAAQSLNETGADRLPSGYLYGRARIYTAIVAVSLQLFGENEVAARMPSVLFGVLSILLAYGLARIWFDTRTALIMAFFMAFSHFEVGWSRTARMYTLLQFMTLWITYCYVRGFKENQAPGKSDPSDQFKPGSVSILWLILLVVMIALSALFVHSITTLLIPGFTVYMLVQSGIHLFKSEGRSRWFNPYTVSLIAGGLIGGAVLLAVPWIRATAFQSFAYTPAWASGSAYAARKTALLEFLLSQWRMPITVFAFLGGFQLITRKHLPGWLPASLFLAPFVLLSLVFTHRVEAYLFFVYPFFLMIAAYGLSNWINAEQGHLPIVQRLGAGGNRFLLIGMVLLLFVLFPWIRVTLNIPRLPDGITNLAVTPEEWRGACQKVLSQKESEDLIITSLPQVALYYGIASDYGLNQVNLEQAQSKKLVNGAGQWIDLYAGVPCVISFEALQSLVAEHPSGWLLISDFHFHHTQYIPAVVRTYIEEHFSTPWMTPQGTVRVYHWKSGGED